MSQPNSLPRLKGMGIRTKQVAAGLLAVSAAVVGGWAQFAPGSFYNSFPGFGHHWVSAAGGYDEHLIRDVGGLFLALFVITAWVAVRPTPETLRLTGVGWLVFNVAHLVFHADHLDGFSTGDKVGNVVSLSLLLLLSIVIVLPTSSAAID
jgi:hypothetical protein